MLNTQDLKALAYISKLSNEKLDSAGSWLMSAHSSEARKIGQTVIEIRLGRDITTTDAATIRMAQAVIEWGRLNLSIEE